jgi:hypothetical protein
MRISSRDSRYHNNHLFYTPLHHYNLFQSIVQTFLLSSHCFWGAWAVVQAGASTVDFDYLLYARKRFEGYAYHKGVFGVGKEEV